MSWLRSSPLRNSFGKQWSRDSPPKDADPTACYDSFCKHWQQTHEIIRQAKSNKGVPLHDDILAVVNHIDQMVTLLLLEFRNSVGLNHQQQMTNGPSHSPCLEYLLSENLLDDLSDWSLTAGRYTNTIRLEQMKLFEILVSFNGSLLAHEPVARPLLKLLEACAHDILPLDVEKKLIVLLNGLCVALMQNLALLDVFFHPNASGERKFIIFSLLMPHIHREGTVGQQARDAMLLCMALSKRNNDIGVYISEHSNVCPVLATGISGLYSVLPRKLDIETEDWHRLTPDDVNDIPALDHLMHSFEFCNAVAQIAHPLVQNQLLEYLYQGFLVPVMGPALLQPSLDDLVSATAYFDLFLRSVTDPGLLQTLIKFLLAENYDECRILDSLIQRISSRSRLCIVTLALFETLVDLNIEDIMLELCFSSLTPCSHVMLSQRRRMRDLDSYGSTAKKFLSLRPSCCLSWSNAVLQSNSKCINKIDNKQTANSPNWLMNYGSRVGESLYGNYHAYLFDARQKIVSCQIGCSYWSSQYNGITLGEDNDSDSLSGSNTNDSSQLSSARNSTERDLSIKFQTLPRGEILDNIKSLLADEEDTIAESLVEDADMNEINENISHFVGNVDKDRLNADIDALLNEEIEISQIYEESLKKNGESNNPMESMFSLGDSSGYESLAMKSSADFTSTNEFETEKCRKKDENDNGNGNDDGNINGRESIEVNVMIKNEGKRTERVMNGKPSVGIFLDVILRKLECLTSNNLYVNLHLTGLISRLAVYRQPLLQSFLLNPSLVFQPSIRSLFQILASLKNKIDQYLSKVENVDNLVEQARAFLIAREYRLVNTRRNALKTTQSVKKEPEKSPAEVFSRNEPKRRSLTSSLTQIFKWPGISALPSPPAHNRTDEQLEMTSDGASNRAELLSSLHKITPTQHVVLCAVLMDEWLKELAAIVQEHVILSLTDSIEF
ncbi:FHIP family protein AAEL005291 [Diachasmimorpha longicaudata]|uniref:FHIP family protein AAEL005291 n=1 Tax=Diachasmimorpha longicaudata TaxID=58733 RepID=UPI0030B8EAD5